MPDANSTPISITAHPSRWLAILEAVMNVFQAVEPVAVIFVPPSVGKVLNTIDQVAPVVAPVAEGVSTAIDSTKA
jgi:hypothetical protein